LKVWLTPLLLLAINLVLVGCGDLGLQRRRVGPAGLGLAGQGREQPALSGQGEWLASVVERNGRQTVMMQAQPSGAEVSLPSLRRFEPHDAPSLSWNGRYLALVGQEGGRRRVLILDRASGRLLPLQLPGDLQPEQVSLAPDARRLALAGIARGRRLVQVFDLANLIEPDLPRGLAIGTVANPTVP
jgi:Tol biopolymer transport system component